MHYDVAFIDAATPRPYHAGTLDTEPLGGSEASLIRVADGLAAAGLRVAVFVHNLPLPMTESRVAYYPFADFTRVRRIDHLVAFRSNAGLDSFPAACKYVWFEDEPDARYRDALPQLLRTRTTAITVSEWHRQALAAIWAPADVVPPMVTCFNPVPDALYAEAVAPHDANKLVWLASPHKGLDRALQTFAALRTQIPSVRLHVYNPGYVPVSGRMPEGVVVEPALPCGALWQAIRDALCVFYPSGFRETFGCIAAEANALRIPVAGYDLAGLSETIGSAAEKSAPGDEAGVIANIIAWHHGARPVVQGQDRFRASRVVQQWQALFAASRANRF